MSFEAYHGVNGAQHQANFNTLSAQGYRMISLSVYGDADSPYTLPFGSSVAARHGWQCTVLTPRLIKLSLTLGRPRALFPF